MQRISKHMATRFIFLAIAVCLMAFFSVTAFAAGEELPVSAVDALAGCAPEAEAPAPVVEISEPAPAEEAPAPAPAAEISEPAPAGEVSAPAPAEEISAPAPAEEISAPAPAVEVSEPAPAVEISEPVPVEEVSEPAPAEEVSAPAPAEEVSAPAPAEEISEPAPAVEVSEPAPAVEVSEPAPAEEISEPVPVEEVSEPAQAEEVSAPAPAEEVSAPAPADEAPISDSPITDESSVQLGIHAPAEPVTAPTDMEPAEMKGEPLTVTPVAQFTAADGHTEELEVGGSVDLKGLISRLGYEGEIESASSSNPQAFEIVDGQLLIKETFQDETLTVVINGQKVAIPVHDPYILSITSEEELHQAFSNPITDTEVQLQRDIFLTQSNLLQNDGRLVLDLNGFVLKGTGSGSVITINGNAELTIKDSNPASRHKGYVDTNGVWRPNEMADDSVAVYISGGIITGGHGNEISYKSEKYIAGGAICNAGTLIMTGGNIAGNEFDQTAVSKLGAGVYNSGSFNMSGGEILYNGADGEPLMPIYGGGVFNAGEFNLSGTSKIANHTYDRVDGGGVFNDGSFTMAGGEISGNSAFSGGGGVCNSGTFTMTGGEISGNESKLVGAGVSSRTSSTGNLPVFCLTGGKITNNNSEEDGGGCSIEAGSFTMTNGEISGNKAKEYGAGIYINMHVEASISGGVICNNEAKTWSGGGIANYGTVTMSSAEISGNEAPDGGGLYNDFNAEFTLNSGKINGNLSGVVNKGCFTMNGGSVSYNDNPKAMGTGGILDSGTFVMNGGEIIGNTGVSYGGIQVSPGASVKLSGNAVIKGNKTNNGNDSNLFLPSGFICSIDEKGFSGEVHVTTEIKPWDVYDGIKFAEKPEDASVSGFVYDSYAQSAAVIMEVKNKTDLVFKAIEAYYFNENSGKGYLDFRNAHGDAQPGDTIIVLYKTTENLRINKDLNIFLNGWEITGTGSDAVIYAENCSLKLMDVQGGKGTVTGGNCGISVKNCNLTIENISVTGNTGSGIYAVGDNAAAPYALVLKNCTISNNSAKENGGGIFVSGNYTCSVSNSEIKGNTADYGGGVYFGGTGNSAFSENASANAPALILQDSTVTENTAEKNGGGIYNAGQFIMNGGSVSKNKAEYGGGIYNAGQFIMNGGSVSNNEAKYGGGFNNFEGAYFSLNSGKISDNSSEFGGGLNNSGVFEMYDGAVISGNKASSAGDGIYIGKEPRDYDLSMNIYGGEITGNGSASSRGGGIYLGVKDGSLTLYGGKIIDNGYTDAPNNIYLANGALFYIPYSGFSGLAGISTEKELQSPGDEVLIAHYRGDNNLSKNISYDRLIPDYVVELKNNSDNVNLSLRVSEPKVQNINSYKKYASFKDALFCAEEGNTLRLLQDCVEDIDITFSVTIDFDGFNLRGTGANSVITVSNGAVLTLIGSEGGEETVGIISNGKAENGGGIFVKDGALSMNCITVEDNSASNNGGGIAVEKGSLSMQKCTIENNTAGVAGGGIYNAGAEVKMSGSVLKGNIASDGGAFYNKNGTLTITECSLESNNADGKETGNGGAVYIEDGTLTLTGSTVKSNNAKGNGGAVYIEDGTLTLTGSTVESNSAKGNGGGFNVKKGVFTLNNSKITKNEASHNGGGIYASGSLSMAGMTVESNIANGNGGGICAVNCEIAMTGKNVLSANKSIGIGNGAGLYAENCKISATDDMEIRNNISAGNGGGVFFEKGSFEFISNGESSIKIKDNKAEKNGGGGGGFYLADGNVTFKRAEISGNNIEWGIGGGICIHKGTFTLSNAIISGNSTIRGGGVSIGNDGIFMLRDAVVSGNAGGDGAGICNEGIFNVETTEISQNTGGGVADYGEMSVSGNVNITGNGSKDSCNNLYIYSAPPIQISENFSGNIGISTEANELCLNIGEIVFARAANTESAKASVGRFFSDQGLKIHQIDKELAFLSEYEIGEGKGTAVYGNKEDSDGVEYSIIFANPGNVTTDNIVFFGTDGNELKGITGKIVKGVLTLKPYCFGESGTEFVNAGTYVLTAVINNVPSKNTIEFTVLPKEVIVSGITAYEKIYDGTLNANLNLSGAVISGTLPGDDLKVDKAAGQLVSKNVGSNIPVQITDIQLSGADTGNYSVSSLSQSQTTEDIVRREVIVTGIAAKNKIYDGTTDVEFDLSGVSFNGIVEGDNLSIEALSGFFESKDVGKGIDVNILNYMLMGSDFMNYSLSKTSQKATAADILPREVHVEGILAKNKQYDGTTQAELDFSNASVIGIIAGDEARIDQNSVGSFITPKVGKNIPVILELDITGPDRENYKISSDSQKETTADIIGELITITGITAESRTYDGTTEVVFDLSRIKIEGVLTGDDVSVESVVGAFTTKDVGIGKLVQIIDFKLTGNDARKYCPSDDSQKTAVADITPKAVTVTADDGKKVYGSDDPTLTATEEGLIGTDKLAYTLTRESGEDVGEYVITPSGEEVQGNYAVTYVAGMLTITPKSVTVMADPKFKVKGDDDPELTATVTGTLEGEEDEIDFTLTREPGEDVGIYDIIPFGLELQGNYDVTYILGSFVISATEELILTVTDYDGEYDACWHGEAATVNITADTTITYSTDFGETWSSDFPRIKDVDEIFVLVVAENKKIGAYAIDSYFLNVTPKAVTVTADAGKKVYGSADPALTVTEEGLIGTDKLVYTLTRESGEDVGSYVIMPSGDELQGNYFVTYVNGTFTITPKSVTVRAKDSYKVQGEADPTLKATVEGALEGEEGLIKYTLTREAGEELGTYAIISTGDAEQGNYIVSYVNGTFEIIERGKLIVIGFDYEGDYDGEYHGVAAETNITEGVTVFYSFDDGATWQTEVPKIKDVNEYFITVKAEKVGFEPDEDYYFLKVTPKEVTIAWSDDAFTYDGQEHAPTAGVIGAVEGEIVTVAVSGAQVNASDDPYTAAASNLSSPNYVFAPDVKIIHEFMIGRKAVTVTADSKSKFVGEKDPELTATMTGTVGMDTVKYILSRETGEELGSYAILVSGDALQGNYIVSFVNGTFKIVEVAEKSRTPETYARYIFEKNAYQFLTGSGSFEAKLIYTGFGAPVTKEELNFLVLRVDGIEVSPENYTLTLESSGDILIEFTVEYMASLAKGDHALTFELNGCCGKTLLTIE